MTAQGGCGARGSRRRITPRARAIAAELGVDLTDVSGTVPDGSIREADVRAAAARPAAKSAAERTASMRLAIARLMARSKREIPHYYVRPVLIFAGVPAEGSAGTRLAGSRDLYRVVQS